MKKTALKGIKMSMFNFIGFGGAMHKNEERPLLQNSTEARKVRNVAADAYVRFFQGFHGHHSLLYTNYGGVVYYSKLNSEISRVLEQRDKQYVTMPLHLTLKRTVFGSIAQPGLGL